MIILITGASHTGKTLLAQRMLEKYKYPYLSIDHLKMGLIRSGNTDLTPEDDDALTDEYIERHFDEIVGHESEIEERLVDGDCAAAGLAADNKKYIDGFRNAGEQIVWIGDDYENSVEALLGDHSPGL